MDIEERRARFRLATYRYRERYPERVKEARKRRYRKEALTARARKSDPKRWGTTVLPNLRARAKRAGLECTVTGADLLVPDVCPVLGTKLTFGTLHNARAMPTNPSVDRIDCSRGYVPDNVRVISLRANMLKSNATVDELERVVAYMKGECP